MSQCRYMTVSPVSLCRYVGSVVSWPRPGLQGLADSLSSKDVARATDPNAEAVPFLHPGQLAAHPRPRCLVWLLGRTNYDPRPWPVWLRLRRREMAAANGREQLQTTTACSAITRRGAVGRATVETPTARQVY